MIKIIKNKRLPSLNHHKGYGTHPDDVHSGVLIQPPTHLDICQRRSSDRSEHAVLTSQEDSQSTLSTNVATSDRLRSVVFPTLDYVDHPSSILLDESEISTHFPMPSLRTFRIEFDRPGATYAPGEIVTGDVIVDLAREKTIRALKLSVKGEANVSWERKRSTKDSQGRNHTQIDHFRASEQYFNLTYYLLGNTAGNGEVRVPAGFHRYSFNFSLPYNIPCSFEHTNGHIRYTMKAVIDRPWRFDHESKIAFTVVSSYDLNAHSHQCIGADDEVSESFCCFCCFNLGSMKLRIRIPTTGFVPGQSIETMVNLNNTSSVNVTKICVKLERSLEFHARSPYSMTKTDKAILKAEQRMGPFGEQADIPSRLQIPPIPPSHLEYCSIIDQKYSLRITIHVSGTHCSITKVYPILIGTIPLHSTISSASYIQTIQQPTAPNVMQYDYDPPPPMPTSPDYVPPNTPYPQAIGFASPNQPSTSTNPWDIPPPSYEECMQRADSIKDEDESNYVHGANEPFAPRYPVFNFTTSHPPKK
ncbi:PREDICTED: arrestin domain-containing protein 17-like [Atta colombica]|uniref:arrestin domain-containing protein 17-like n=1 Tax=Atta colombica TaxID=520822 RepID=UPI00084C5F75|nr:PREDICTED: arrestin domain-containing protein 17-like [Atta colombica]